MSGRSRPPVRPVQEELRQPRAFATLRQEALVTLLRTTDRVRRYLRAVLEPAGITHQQYNVLRILRGAGGELAVMEIRDRMIEEAPGITALLNRLEIRDLVVRCRGETDRRQVYCRVTAEGRRLLERLDRVVDEADEIPLGGLSDAQVRQLIRLLNAARASIPET